MTSTRISEKWRIFALTFWIAMFIMDIRVVAQGDYWFIVFALIAATAIFDYLFRPGYNER